MKHCLLLAIVFPFAVSGAQAKDMFYSLEARWCDDDGRMAFEITPDGVLFDGQPGEAPRCVLKNATNRQMPVGEHRITWRCDPTPPHEPGDKPTPRSRLYDLTERLATFVVHDNSGERLWLLVRDRPRKEIGIYRQCRD
jgi:hypothetical protein